MTKHTHIFSVGFSVPDCDYQDTDTAIRREPHKIIAGLLERARELMTECRGELNEALEHVDTTSWDDSPRSVGHSAPLADAACTECEGHGYDAFDTTQTNGHAPVELQRNDGCGCLSERKRNAGLQYLSGDEAAAQLWVWDLQAGLPWALRVAQRLAAHADAD